MIKNNKQGFSLIELMVVVGIIGILASVAVPNLLKFQAKAKQVNAKSELSAIYTLERAMYVEYTQYSPHLKVLGFAPEGLTEANKGLVSGCIQQPPNTADFFDSNGASATWPTRYYAVGFKIADDYKYANPSLAAAYTSAGTCKVTDVRSTIKNAGAFITVSAEDKALVTSTPANTFLAMASGRIISDEAVLDKWTIDHNKVLLNSTVGY